MHSVGGSNLSQNFRADSQDLQRHLKKTLANFRVQEKIPPAQHCYSFVDVYQKTGFQLCVGRAPTDLSFEKQATAVMNIGVVVGGAVGGTVFVVIVVFLVYYFIFRKHSVNWNVRQEAGEDTPDKVVPQIYHTHFDNFCGVNQGFTTDDQHTNPSASNNHMTETNRYHRDNTDGVGCTADFDKSPSSPQGSQNADGFMEDPYATIEETVPKREVQIQRVSCISSDSSSYQRIDDVLPHTSPQATAVSQRTQPSGRLIATKPYVVANPTNPSSNSTAATRAKPALLPKPRGLLGSSTQELDPDGKARTLPYKYGPEGDIYRLVDKRSGKLETQSQSQLNVS